jgi:hypothetical protein
MKLLGKLSPSQDSQSVQRTIGRADWTLQVPRGYRVAIKRPRPQPSQSSGRASGQSASRVERSVQPGRQDLGLRGVRPQGHPLGRSQPHPYQGPRGARGLRDQCGVQSRRQDPGLGGLRQEGHPLGRPRPELDQGTGGRHGLCDKCGVQRKRPTPRQRQPQQRGESVGSKHL